MTAETIVYLVCRRCPHRWLKRVELPQRCPSCGSRKWREAKP